MKMKVTKKTSETHRKKTKTHQHYIKNRYITRELTVQKNTINQSIQQCKKQNTLWSNLLVESVKKKNSLPRRPVWNTFCRCMFGSACRKLKTGKIRCLSKNGTILRRWLCPVRAQADQRGEMMLRYSTQPTVSSMSPNQCIMELLK